MRQVLPARALRTLFALVLASAGVTCRDSGPTGPGRLAPTRAWIALTSTLAADAPGVPIAPWRRAHVQLFLLPGELLARDTTIVYADGDTASTVSLGVTVTVPEQRFLLVLTLLDDAGLTVYSARDTVTAYVPGASPPPPPAVVTLVYAGPDTAARTVAIAPRDTVLAVGDAVRFRAVARRADGSAITGAVIAFSARGIGITVAPDGTVQATAPVASGGATVIARLATGLSDSTFVTVTATPASLALTPDSTLLVVGRTALLSASLRDATGAAIAGHPVSFTSADTTIATVSAGGLVAARAPGIVTITARSATLSASAKVVVVPVPVARIVLRPDTALTVPVNTTASLTAQALDSAGGLLARAIAWNSSDTTVARVTADTLGHAVVLGRAAGTVTITASAGGQAASVAVSVPAPVTGALPPATITITPASATLSSLGELATLSAIVRDANGTVLFTTPSWVSRAPSVATVAADGTVQAVANGVTWMVASAGVALDSARVDVRQAVDTILVPRDTIPLALNDTATIVATLLDRNRNPITDMVPAFTTSDAKVVTVTSTGHVTLVGSGTATVLASAGGKRREVVVMQGQGTGGVTASLAWIRLTPGGGTVRMGGTLPLVAELVDATGAAAAITPQWASDQPGRAPVSASGVVTFVDTTTVTVTATSQGIAGHAIFTVLAAPSVTAFSFAPTALTGASTSTVRFSVSVGGADPGDGIASVEVEFTGPTSVTSGCVASAPTSGTAHRGTWDCAISLPAGSATGAWHATRVTLAGTVTRSLGEAQLAAFGATTLTVAP